MVGIIGRLDRSISEMIEVGNRRNELDSPDRQTLKHHAEDMKLAGEHILKKIKEAESQ